MSLDPIYTPGKLRKFGTYDLEWYPHPDPETGVLQLRLIGVFFEDRYWGFHGEHAIEEFLSFWLQPEHAGTWLYAHAGGKFDLRFILDYLVQNHHADLDISCSFSGSHAIIVKMKRGRNVWYFLDSYWLLRTSLRKIGKLVGIDKGGEDVFDREPCHYPREPCTCDPVYYAPMPELMEYNEQDCRVLYAGIELFQEYLYSLGGQLEMTAASSAMNLFRRAYLSRTIKPVPHVNQIARQAYTASRVEVFEKHCVNANYYDVNSSFPYAMTFEAPGNFIGTTAGMPDPDTGMFLVRARIFVPDTNLPPLPYRHSDHGVYFPTGTWDAWLSNIDVITLMEGGGRLERVEEVLHFEPFHEMKEYAETIYEKRKLSTFDGEKAILKILLNSLYGKFAERSEKFRMVIHPASTSCPHKSPRGGPLHPDNSCMTMVMPGVWIVRDIKQPKHQHVPASVHITAIARRTLYTHMRASERVYYCDTDGFACPETSILPESKELGGLKLEKIIREGYFHSPKFYAYQRKAGEGGKELPAREQEKWTIKAKGFSRLTYESFTSLVAHNQIEIERFTGMREAFRAGVTAPMNKTFPKQLRGKNRPKRVFAEDGTSRPWRLAELAEPWEAP